MNDATAPRRRGRPPSGGREAILDAALAVVREQGVATLTSREVAARAGVSDASVYYHFGDRRGLLIATYEYGMAPLRYLDDMPAGADWREVIARAVGVLETFYNDLLPILYAAQADNDIGELVSSYTKENDLGPHRGVGYLGDYLRAEQQAGRVHPDADVDAVALSVINTAFGRAARRHLRAPDEEDSRLPSLERVLRTIGRILEPPPA